MAMNDTWGYKSEDHNYQSTETLVRNLIDIASMGVNYLLNIGPDATGTIPQPQADRLREVGEWLEVNGEAIYTVKQTPFPPEAASSAWRCAMKPGKLQFHLFEWPEQVFKLPRIEGSVTGAYLLAQGDVPLHISKAGNQMAIALPTPAPDPVAAVLVATFYMAGANG